MKSINLSNNKIIIGSLLFSFLLISWFGLAGESKAQQVNCEARPAVHVCDYTVEEWNTYEDCESVMANLTRDKGCPKSRSDVNQETGNPPRVQISGELVYDADGRYRMLGVYRDSFDFRITGTRGDTGTYCIYRKGESCSEVTGYKQSMDSNYSSPNLDEGTYILEVTADENGRSTKREVEIMNQRRAGECKYYHYPSEDEEDRSTGTLKEGAITTRTILTRPLATGKTFVEQEIICRGGEIRDTSSLEGGTGQNCTFNDYVNTNGEYEEKQLPHHESYNRQVIENGTLLDQKITCQNGRIVEGDGYFGPSFGPVSAPDLNSEPADAPPPGDGIDLKANLPEIDRGNDFDAINGTYNNVTINVSMQNNGPGDLPANSRVSYAGSVKYPDWWRKPASGFWPRPSTPLPDDISEAGFYSDALASGAETEQLTRVLDGVPFGENEFCSRVNLDPTNYTEHPVNSASYRDNTACKNVTLPAPQPPMSIDIDDSSTLSWSAHTAYPLDCEVRGPDGVIDEFDASKNHPSPYTETTAVNDEADQFVLTCTEYRTYTVFEEATGADNTNTDDDACTFYDYTSTDNEYEVKQLTEGETYDRQIIAKDMGIDALVDQTITCQDGTLKDIEDLENNDTESGSDSSETGSEADTESESESGIATTEWDSVDYWHSSSPPPDYSTRMQLDPKDPNYISCNNRTSDNDPWICYQWINQESDNQQASGSGRISSSINNVSEDESDSDSDILDDLEDELDPEEKIKKSLSPSERLKSGIEKTFDFIGGLF